MDIKFKRILKNLLKVFYILPIKKNKIFTSCFAGKKIGFDSKAIVDWINENEPNKYEIIWGVDTKEQEKLKYDNVKFVKIKSIKGIVHMITSKVLLYNINPPDYIPFRKNQIIINTWHGGGFIKKVRKIYSRI